MLLSGVSAINRQGLADRVGVVQGRAEGLPFPDETFDAIVFTFLLRYVDDPEVTVREMVRVLKPGGQLLSLEFAVPENAVARGLWAFYTRAVMPLVTIPVSRGWRHVGSFLGPNISKFCQRHPMEELRETWRRCGMGPVSLSRRSFGAAVVMWSEKEGGRGNG
jgi:demethylmenaquinone methyltransferase/2-methoxy-6-polyprenyl-1,4-benzoquinol methylase